MKPVMKMVSGDDDVDVDDAKTQNEGDLLKNRYNHQWRVLDAYLVRVSYLYKIHK